MNLKKNTVDILLTGKSRIPKNDTAEAFAPSNIALCKYWGKRDRELNLPLTNSLSISLNDKGAITRVSLTEGTEDVIFLNKQGVPKEDHFAKALSTYLDLFRSSADIRFRVDTEVNIPIAAGLASSACGFAAMAKALNALYGWALTEPELSVLARLGSGSASRSLWNGFVEWQCGQCAEGLDSYGVPLDTQWPEFRIGLLILETTQKKYSSRMAMENTVNTSPFYKTWPKVVAEDLCIAKRAIETQDFNTLGAVSEGNALAMHALMMSARPAILYSTEETLKAQNRVWKARDQGLSLYFTQDAGPNLKLLFLDTEADNIRTLFPNVQIVNPFANIEKVAYA